MDVSTDQGERPDWDTSSDADTSSLQWTIVRSSWAVETTFSLSPGPEEYELPYPVHLAFQRRLYEATLECFSQYFQGMYGRDLEREQWRQENLTRCCWSGFRMPDTELCDKPWSEPEHIEMEYWVRLHDCLFRQGAEIPYLSSKMISALNDLRHETIHRKLLSASVLASVMRLSGLLGDSERASETEAWESTMRNYPLMDAKEKEEVSQVLFAASPSYKTALQVLKRVERLLELSCFEHARHTDNWRAAQGKFPEQYEMGDWEQSWKGVKGNVKHINVGKGIDGHIQALECLRGYAMGRAKELRNAVAHRSALSDRNIKEFAGAAMLCMLLMDDRTHALKVEIIVEAFLTSSRCENVIERLLVAMVGDFPSRQETILTFLRSEQLGNDWSFILSSRMSKSAEDGRMTELKPVNARLGRSRDSHPRLDNFFRKMFSNEAAIPDLIARYGLSEEERNDLRRSAFSFAVNKFVYDTSTHPILRFSSWEDEENVRLRSIYLMDDVEG